MTSARSFDSLRAIVPFLRPYRVRLLAAFVALLVASAAMLVMPIAVRDLIDRGMTSEDAATVNRYFLGFLAAAVVFGVFAALRYYFVTWLGERVVADLRDSIYRRVIRMDPTFYEVTRTGEVLSRLTTDTTLVQSIAGVSLSITLRSTLNLVGALIAMVFTSATLTGVIVVLIPIVMLPLFAVGKRVRTLSRAAQDRIAESSGLAGETLSAVQVVQAFTLEELQSKRYAEAVEEGFRVARRRTHVRSVLTAVGTTLSVAAITFVLWLGAKAVIDGRMSGGQLGQFLIYASIVTASAGMLIEQMAEVQRAAGAMDRLAQLLIATPAITAPPIPYRCPCARRGTCVSRTSRSTIRRVPRSQRCTTSRWTSRPARPSRSWVHRVPARARSSSCCCVSTIRRAAV